MKVYILTHVNVDEHHDADEKLDFGAPYLSVQAAKNAALEIAAYPDDELGADDEIQWQEDKHGIHQGEWHGTLFFRIRQFEVTR